MYTNLWAEMAKTGVTIQDVASAIGRTRKTAALRIKKTSLSVEEGIIIHKEFFPHLTPAYLFEKDKAV
jgi:hypothetical protein